MTIYALMGFFLIQLTLYIVCCAKLASIRKSGLPPVMQRRLLENEEPLFDAGLYVGLSGTVIALLMLALGIFEASLVAAYASTLFGILFVAALKIFNVRPLRRSLLLAEKSPLRRPDDTWGDAVD